MAKIVFKSDNSIPKIEVEVVRYEEIDSGRYFGHGRPIGAFPDLPAGTMFYMEVTNVSGRGVDYIYLYNNSGATGVPAFIVNNTLTNQGNPVGDSGKFLCYAYSIDEDSVIHAGAAYIGE